MMTKTFTCLLTSATLALVAVQPAGATDYNGTLDFNTYAASTTIDVFGTLVPITVGFDLDRYDLGSSLSTNSVTFTSHNAYNTTGTMAALVFTTDPNNALFADPTSLVGLINPTTNATTFLNDHVTGWQYAVYGNGLVPNGTTDVSGLFSPRMTFVPGTHYYAFVAGGSVFQSGAPVDAAIGYTLSVNAVPEPETYAMFLAGLGLMGAIARHRKNV
jgi:hypothetical protein